MLRSMKEVYGYDVLGADGEIGVVDEFYFDDQHWTIRYLVVNTHKWLPGRRLLVSPLALSKPLWAARMLPATLTREQVEKSPDIDLDKPISRQHEIILNEHYGWHPWWTAMRSVPPPPTHVEKEVERVAEGDPHLRSIREVIGYHIQARDGEIGHVEDFILSEPIWDIQYMVVDTRNWLPGRRVLVALQWIIQVAWAEQKVHLDLLRRTVKDSPEYDPLALVNQASSEEAFY